MKYHPRHDEIVATVKRFCPFGEVRVINEPLHRPCDYAVVVDGPEGKYTVAAPAPGGWKEVAAVQAAGLSFSVAYARVFDLDGAKAVLARGGIVGDLRMALRQRIADNEALNATVAAIMAS